MNFFYKDKNLKDILIKQAIVVPFAAALLPMLIGFTVPEYSSVSQHLSELALLDHPIALIIRIADVIMGVSLLLLALGLLLSAPKRFFFTIVTSCILGASMMSNGLFVMGSPLHGLYGAALILPLAPACFAAEFCENRKIVTLSLAVALFTMVYLWLMLFGFDPEGFRGLTQRAATLIMWGWYSLASYALIKNGTVP